MRRSTRKRTRHRYCKVAIPNCTCGAVSRRSWISYLNTNTAYYQMNAAGRSGTCVCMCVCMCVCTRKRWTRAYFGIAVPSSDKKAKGERVAYTYWHSSRCVYLRVHGGDSQVWCRSEHGGGTRPVRGATPSSGEASSLFTAQGARWCCPQPLMPRPPHPPPPPVLPVATDQREVERNKRNKRLSGTKRTGLNRSQVRGPVSGHSARRVTPPAAGAQPSPATRAPR